MWKSLASGHGCEFGNALGGALNTGSLCRRSIVRTMLYKRNSIAASLRSENARMHRQRVTSNNVTVTLYLLLEHL